MESEITHIKLKFITTGKQKQKQKKKEKKRKNLVVLEKSSHHCLQFSIIKSYISLATS